MNGLPPEARRARLLRLQSAVAICDRLGGLLRSRRSRTDRRGFPEPGQGISVIVPERGSPHLLHACLSALESAVREVTEPLETIVVVNGTEPRNYYEDVRRFRSVRWIFVDAPMSFAGAIGRGLSAARYPWAYLLNSDVELEGRALAELLPWRAAHVFAIASQILPQDSSRRREETGWTALRCPGGLAEIFDTTPEDETTVRGGVYAGGGSSLFQTALLRRMIPWSEAYAPFYWEDAEWGVQAWKQGYETLFCPSSRAWHARRATISRFYDEREIERIFRRNGLLFQLRNLDRTGSPEQVFAAAVELDDISFLQMTSKRNTAGVMRMRLRGAMQRFDDSCLEFAQMKYYLRPPAALRSAPVVLMVSPFAMHPPAHGGAIRMCQLAEGLSGKYNVVLLSDESEAVRGAPAASFGNLAAIHYIGGREAVAPDAGRGARDAAHCHHRMRQELLRLVATVGPAAVQIEFSELAGLSASRCGGVPWAITLHDVTIGMDGTPDDDAAGMKSLSRFDRVFVCSDEDAALVPQLDPVVVPNGMEERAYVPSSQEARAILFAGPFRYKPNYDGIEAFVRRVFPELRRRVPGTELWILAGAGAAECSVPELRPFQVPGVTLYDYNADPRPFLLRCALTVNPVFGIRGSSVKLLESAAAGRVCVSTRDGARGFLSDPPASLIVADRLEDLVEPLERLLLDDEYRRSIEAPRSGYLARHSWPASAARFVEEYERLLGRPGVR